MKAKRLFILRMSVVLLTLGMVLIGCDSGNNPTGSVGNIRIRVTGIPSDVMSAGQNGLILIGIGPANAFNNVSDALAGRDTNIFSSDDLQGNDWYEFSLYKIDNYQEEYTGAAGNYDIGFMYNSSAKFARNKRLEVNMVNTIPYSAFQ
jgi:hypothetical protein